MATHLKSIQPTADPLDDVSLPGWLYFDDEFFQAEKRSFLRAAPQVVCHESEIANPGEWRTIDFLGESVIVIRGDDGEVRAFTNVCRHRGSRLLDGEAGCSKVLTCPYHAWSYARDGRLVGVMHRHEYPNLEADKLGLIPVTMEIWRGFVFVRLEDGLPSVHEMMAPYEAEVAPYRFEDLRAIETRRNRLAPTEQSDVVAQTGGTHDFEEVPDVPREFAVGWGACLVDAHLRFEAIDERHLPAKLLEPEEVLQEDPRVSAAAWFLRDGAGDDDRAVGQMRLGLLDAAGIASLQMSAQRHLRPLAYSRTAGTIRRRCVWSTGLPLSRKPSAFGGLARRRARVKDTLGGRFTPDSSEQRRSRKEREGAGFLDERRRAKLFLNERDLVSMRIVATACHLTIMACRCLYCRP